MINGVPDFHYDVSNQYFKTWRNIPLMVTLIFTWTVDNSEAFDVNVDQRYYGQIGKMKFYPLTARALEGPVLQWNVLVRS